MSSFPLMLYTVGLVAKYEKAIDAGGAMKLGQRNEGGRAMHGGWVWKSREEAQAYIDAQLSVARRAVYGVEADWERDTYEAPGEPTRCLLRDAPIVRLG